MVFFGPVATFFLLAAAEVDAGAAAGAVAGVAALLAAAATGFLVDAFFVGEAERLRLLVPVADFALLVDDDAFFFFSPAAFLLPPGVFDRLRGLAAADFLAAGFFFIPDAALAFTGTGNLKLPLAPTPLVCFKDLFFVPARNADFRCWFAVAALTLKLAKIYFKIAAFDVPLRSFSFVNACLIIAAYLGWLLADLAFLALLAAEPPAVAFVFLALLALEAPPAGAADPLCDVLADDDAVALVRSVIVWSD